MADDKNDPRRKVTNYKMEHLPQDESRQKPKKQVGKRQFQAGEARGLAAFEKKADRDEFDEDRPRREDTDLRQARVSAHDEDESGDDGMVATSKSFFDEGGAAAPAGKGGKGGKGGAAAAGESGGKRGGGAWKWIVGLLVLGGGGAAAAVVLMGDKKAAPVEDTHAAATTKKAAPDTKEEEDTTEPADTGAADATPDVAKAEPKVALQPMNVSDPAAWAAKVEASNGWVAVAAAPAGRMLGLSASDASDGRASLRTGLRPEAKLAAPDKAYRVQAHEVTWAELEAADTLPDVATFARPKWVPGDAKKRASLPATGVPWSLAKAFCVGMGGDLPSEAEWEWVARGSADNYYPWGRAAFGPDEVHTVASGAVPVIAVKGAKLDKTTGTAIYDLLGNAQEWTRDPWRAADQAAPNDARSKSHRAIRGWPLTDPGTPIPSEGSTYRAAACAEPACMAAEAAALERIGFRCVRGGS